MWGLLHEGKFIFVQQSFFSYRGGFGAASFCIQNYFHWAVACPVESFYNKERPQGQDISRGAGDQRNLSLAHIRGDTSE